PDRGEGEHAARPEPEAGVQLLGAGARVPAHRPRRAVALVPRRAAAAGAGAAAGLRALEADPGAVVHGARPQPAAAGAAGREAGVSRGAFPPGLWSFVAPAPPGERGTVGHDGLPECHRTIP